MDPGVQVGARSASFWFSGVKRLPVKEAKILSEEHKAVLLVVIGYRQKGGISKSRVGRYSSWRPLHTWTISCSQGADLR